MSRFATRFKRRQHTENITDDDKCPAIFKRGNGESGNGESGNGEYRGIFKRGNIGESLKGGISGNL